MAQMSHRSVPVNNVERRLVEDLPDRVVAQPGELVQRVRPVLGALVRGLQQVTQRLHQIHVRGLLPRNRQQLGHFCD